MIIHYTVFLSNQSFFTIFVACIKKSFIINFCNSILPLFIFGVLFLLWTFFLVNSFYFSIFNSFLFIFNNHLMNSHFTCSCPMILLNIFPKIWSWHILLWCITGRPFFLLWFLADICSLAGNFVSFTGNGGLFWSLVSIYSIESICFIAVIILLLNEYLSLEEWF